MADFNEKDELEEVMKKLESASEIVKKPNVENAVHSIEDTKSVEENQSGEIQSTGDSGFLDEDLDEDFVDGYEAEAFLNEVGDVGWRDKRIETKDAPPVRRSRKKQPSTEEKTEKTEKTEKEEKTEEIMPVAEKKSLKKGRTAAAIAGVLALAALVVGGSYLAMGQKYNKVFFPNTRINGIDASGKTAEEVKQMIASGIDGYVLTIEQRDGKTEQIAKDDIKLHSEFDGSLEKMIEEQEPIRWLGYKMSPSSYEIATMIAYDETAFSDKLNSLDCLNTALAVKPEDAHLSEYTVGHGYSIVPEILGSTTVSDVVKGEITNAIMNLKEKISLEEAGAYLSPTVKKEDAALMSLRDTLNQYAGVTVTYKFGDKTEVLTGERTHEWLIPNADLTVSLDSAKAAAYVEELALTYDTYNKAKTLKTSYGPTIKVSGGTYGWRINRSAETEALIEVIRSGQSGEREPVYSQKAASRGSNDYGSTYVEINLTAQHLFFYKNGSLVVESDFVSGNLSRGWGTPGGTYPLNYKERNATLKGENYRTPVDYWMPYNGGIGLHDAKWRSSFGGSIYKTGGSHGCVNLPHGVAQKIFENITPGVPVIGYNLAGTEAAGSSSTKPAETPPAPTEAPAETVPVPTEPIVPTQPPTEAPAGPAGNPQPTPSPQPTPPAPQPQPTPAETTAPAGPGSDNISGSGSGPGSV